MVDGVDIDRVDATRVEEHTLGERGLARVDVCADADVPDLRARGAFWLGLEGFSTKFGIDVTGDDQAILGVALDIGDLGTPRLRLRPSIEVGFGSSFDTYVVGAEMIYRFTSDEERAVPYVGLGGAVFSQEDCGAVEGCPEVWLQFALGFELRLRQHLNWLVEYHAEDAFGRHRLMLGLATRRAN